MHIDLKLGLSCNNACIHCIMEPVRLQLLRETRKTDSSFQDVSSILNTVIERGATSVTLTGGEPTLRKDFFEILQGLSQKNIAITVQSNGRRLSTPQAFERLQALARRDILFVIALHADSASIHDEITRVPGSFEETVRAIRALHELGFRLCGKMVLSRLNCQHIQGTLDLMQSLGFDEAVVAFPHAEEFTPEALEMVVPRYAEVREALSGLSSPFLKNVFWETIPYCQMPHPEFFRHSIDLDFLRSSLNEEKTYIEMTMTGQHIDWEESRKEIKAKGACCTSCLLEKVCEGVWEEYLPLHGEGDLIPITDIAQAEALWSSL